MELYLYCNSVAEYSHVSYSFFFINFRPFVRRAGGAQGLPPHPELSRAQAFSQLAKSVRPQSELGRCQLSFVG